MTISPKERESKVRVVVDKDPVPVSFEKWGQPGHFRPYSGQGAPNHHLDLEPPRSRP